MEDEVEEWCSRGPLKVEEEVMTFLVSEGYGSSVVQVWTSG